MSFDLNIKGNGLQDNLKLAEQASKYGWKHINFSYGQDDFQEAYAFKDELSEMLEDVISFDYTLEIKSNSINEIKKFTQKFRNKASCISVVGGDLKVNRAVLETLKCDILSRPYRKRYDCGMNHVLAKEAVKNNVAVELCFNDVLRSYLSPRSKIISNFKDIYTLYYKYGFPLVLSSRAKSVFDIKTAADFKSFFMQTGLAAEDIDSSFKTGQNILKFNKNRKNMILKGVRRISDEA